MTDIWLDRRIEIGSETAESLARCYNRDNWRGHPEVQRESTQESLEALGWIGSVKKNTRTGRLFDGHLRVELALLKDPQSRVPVDYYDLSEEEEALALQILDATTEMAEPIPEKLAALMEKTRTMVAGRPGLSAMLAKLKERAGLGAGQNGQGNGAGPEPGPLVDKAEELQKKWQVQKGQVWKVDRHFIICGDCRELETWKRLLAAAGIDKANGVFTSPPYAEQRKKQYGGVATDKYVEWWEAVQANVRANLASDGSFFVNIKPHTEEGQRVLYVFDLVCKMVRGWGWKFVDEFIWKHQGMIGRWSNRFKNRFEPVYHFALSAEIKMIHANVIQGFSANSSPDSLTVYDGIDNRPANTGSPFKQGGKRSAEFDGALPGNVLEIANTVISARMGAYQAAAFPVALPEFFVKAYSDEGDTWLDPFVGSGTVIVACERNNRIGMGIEKLPKYCAVILERLQGLGLTPKLVN